MRFLASHKRGTKESSFSTRTKLEAVSTHDSVIEKFRRFKLAAFDGEVDPLTTKGCFWKLEHIIQFIGWSNVYMVQCICFTF